MQFFPISCPKRHFSSLNSFESFNLYTFNEGCHGVLFLTSNFYTTGHHLQPHILTFTNTSQQRSTAGLGGGALLGHLSVLSCVTIHQDRLDTDARPEGDGGGSSLLLKSLKCVCLCSARKHQIPLYCFKWRRLFHGVLWIAFGFTVIEFKEIWNLAVTCYYFSRTVSAMNEAHARRLLYGLTANICRDSMLSFHCSFLFVPSLII